MSAATKSAYTPGPWAVFQEECDKPYIRIRGTRFGCRFKIANVLTPVYEGSELEIDETRANARLIAAAPDLAEACALLVDAATNAPPIRLIEHISAAVVKARAALAKAGVK